MNADQWREHHTFESCKVRCLTDNDAVMDEIAKFYPAAKQELHRVIKKATPDSPFTMSLMRSFNRNRSVMKSAAFCYWLPLKGRESDEAGFALFEVLHPATEWHFGEASLILFEFVSLFPSTKPVEVD